MYKHLFKNVKKKYVWPVSAFFFFSSGMRCDPASEARMPGLPTPGNGCAFRTRDSDPEALMWAHEPAFLTSISQFLQEPHLGK